MAAGPLDLAHLGRARRAAHCSVLKRERLSREARERLQAARRQAAQAQAACDAANQALADAHGAYRAAVQASLQAGSGSSIRGREILVHVRHCERAAQLIVTRQEELAQVQARLSEAEAQVATCQAEWTRAEHRLDQSRRQVDEWQARQRLAIDMHADLALEDEPSAHRPHLDDGRAMREHALGGTTSAG
jgi:hypothetical protein